MKKAMEKLKNADTLAKSGIGRKYAALLVMTGFRRRVSRTLAIIVGIMTTSAPRTSRFNAHAVSPIIDVMSNK